MQLAKADMKVEAREAGFQLRIELRLEVRDGERGRG